MFSYIWPIALVVFANIIYNIATKSTPSEANAFLSLVVTYCVAALCALVMYFIQGGHQKLSVEFSKLNWTAAGTSTLLIPEMRKMQQQNHPLRKPSNPPQLPTATSIPRSATSMSSRRTTTRKWTNC